MLTSILQHQAFEFKNPAVISHTQGRYVLDKDTKIVYDCYLDEEISPNPDSGLYPISVLEQYNMTYWELYMLSFKANHIPTHDFLKRIGGGALSCFIEHEYLEWEQFHPDIELPRRELTWFIDVESSNIPGAFYIPMFTRYMMDSNFDIYHVENNVLVRVNKDIPWSESPEGVLSEIVVKLQRDDGLWFDVHWVDIVGIMFKESRSNGLDDIKLWDSRQYMLEGVIDQEGIKNGDWLEDNLISFEDGFDEEDVEDVE